MNRTTGFLVISLLLSGCKLMERDPNWQKYRDADPELVFRSKATKPPNKGEMNYVVDRHMFGKYDYKAHLYTNVESACYLNASTIQIIQSNEDGSQIQSNLSPLDPGLVTVYYNLEDKDKSWVITKASYDRPIDRTTFENVYRAVIHLPRNYRLEMCK